jgi:hypothetical protein
MAGWETRMITKAKKPTSASVTAPMAAMRPGPSLLKNPRAPSTASNPPHAPGATPPDAAPH